MNILILGGTVFLGKHIVQSALKKKHNVTIFNRGISNPELFPDIEKLRGNRNGDFETLKGRTFDAVIDTCGYFPRIVKMSAEFLKDNINHYTFISSIAVYKNWSANVINEESETTKLEDESVEKLTVENYGPLKASCEKSVLNIFKDNALIIRSHLIIGEDDPFDRMTYWVHRISEGGVILVPDVKDNQLHFIDVKDISKWIIKMVEEGKNGIYNVTGPENELKLENFINKCLRIIGNENITKIEWVKKNFLLRENTISNKDFPVFLMGQSKGANNIEFNKAINNGLKFRSLENTLIDILNFDKFRNNHILKSGLTAEREKELLEKWINLKSK